MKTNNHLLKNAEAAIVRSGIAENNKVASSYKGAISSFGASLIMSGLIPTIQFYMSDSSNRDSDHSKIINAIAMIIYESPNDNVAHLKQEVMRATNRIEINKLRKKIADAAIALKIMLRTCEFQKTEEVA